MEKPPDFFLTVVAESGQGVDIARVRACWVKGRLTGKFSDQLAWVEVSPPVLGREHDIEDLGELVIATRFKGDTLLPVLEWPLHVRVYRIINRAITDSLMLAQPDQLQLLFWAEVYRTREDAEAEVARYPVRYP